MFYGVENCEHHKHQRYQFSAGTRLERMTARTGQKPFAIYYDNTALFVFDGVSIVAGQQQSAAGWC
jgi:hypothetical protein